MSSTLFKRGFTLIELLVVIAIIGILASVVLAGLGSQRERARLASAQSTLRSIVPVAQICVDGGGNVANAAPVAGDDICSDPDIVDDVYPILPTDWAYTPSTDVGTDNFQLGATDATAGNTVTCTQTGCTTS